jgi:hypothetical protein
MHRGCKKIETNGGLEQGWPTSNNWKKVKEKKKKKNSLKNLKNN